MVAIAIVARSGMLKYQGLFEPDGFFHYSVVLQTIANHYIVPLNSSLSGYTEHNYISEPTGLYYMTVIPYFFLGFFGITALEIMRYIGIVFGILDCIAAYFLAKRLSGSRNLGLLAFFFVAVSNGDIARTAALVYRGDTFVTFFAAVALLLMLKTIDSEGTRKYAYAALSGFVLSIASFVWNGAPYAVVIYVAAVGLLAFYAFVTRQRKLSVSTLLLSGSLLLWYLLVNAYTMTKVIREQQSLTSIHFFLFYLPVVFGILLSIYLDGLKDGRIHAFLQHASNRVLLVIVFIIILIGLMYALNGSYLSVLLGGGGGVIANNNIGLTTQELQKPTWSFIWASFAYQIIFAPIGLVLFIAVHLIKKRKKGSGMHSQPQIYAFIVLFVYFSATMWLQINALRYNSLVALPIAMFSAYFVYILGKVVYDFSIARGKHQYLFYIFVALMLILMFLCARLAYIEGQSSTQADGINPLFLQAVTWLRGNTPSNATVLALWPDGSVVEGWGNRRSYLDSVGGELTNHIINNSQFVMNSTTDQQYLYSIGKPDYLIVRDYWFAELDGIALEANIPSSIIGNYGYNQLIGNRISQPSSNSIVYSFYTEVQNAQGQTGYVTVNATVDHYQNGTITANAYINPISAGIAPQPMESVIFYNGTSGLYSKYNYSGTGALNYTLLITVVNRTITSAVLAGPALTNSNMFKWLVLCNSQVCPYGNSNVSLQEVYANTDSKIFRIVYK